MASPTGVTSALLTPLQATDAAIPITVAGQADAQLLVPVGATNPRPVVTLLFPSVNGLAQQCEAYGKRIRGSTFVLCQAAESAQQTLVSVDAASDLVASALRASLRVVKARYNRYLNSGSMSLVGVGDAAEIVAPIVRRNPDAFGRVALLDGGFRNWTAVDSARFAQASGKAFCAYCGVESCRSEASRVIATIKALGVPTRLEFENERSLAATQATTGAGGWSARDAGARDSVAISSGLLEWLLSAEGLGAPTDRRLGDSRDAGHDAASAAAGAKSGNTALTSRSKPHFP